MATVSTEGAGAPVGTTGPTLQPREKTVIDRVLYGLGSIAFGVKDTGFTVLLMIFYNQALGLPAATVGFAMRSPIPSSAG